MKLIGNHLIVAGVIAVAWLWAATPASAHCDTMDGPVVADARIALERKDLAPALKWIKPEHEAEVKAAFARTLAVRAQGREARELAEQFFFETLVRLHRAGEGAPFTSLKPAGTKLDPAVETADQALESGEADALIKTLSDEVAHGIRRRFKDAVEKQQHAGHNVEAGREYVAAYVEFVHYVEAVHTTATRAVQAHGHMEATVQPTKAASEHNH
jgi:hypothetical protein